MNENFASDYPEYVTKLVSLFGDWYLTERELTDIFNAAIDKYSKSKLFYTNFPNDIELRFNSSLDTFVKQDDYKNHFAIYQKYENGKPVNNYWVVLNNYETYPLMIPDYCNISKSKLCKILDDYTIAGGYADTDGTMYGLDFIDQGTKDFISFYCMNTTGEQNW